jgi:spermidine/putrescine transport system substrate-binding protein
MKKLSIVVALALVAILGACTEQRTLYVLNWGDYINFDLVEAFETEFNVRVVYEEVDSNESMYERIIAGNTNYDIAMPSDYMVERLKNQGLILELDQSRLIEAEFFPTVMDVTRQATIDGWGSPYFFGSIGLMYREALADAVQTYGFRVLFDPSVVPAGTRIGMYNNPREAVGSALLYLGYSVNTTNDAELLAAENALNQVNYAVIGDDNLKTLIANGNLDIALVYSGDFFDTFYVAVEEEVEIDFGFYSPMINNLWVDYMVIPTTTQNEDLAYEFINFFRDVDNALENHYYVGYAPPMVAVWDIIKADPENDYITSIPAFLELFISPEFQGQVYRDLGNAHSQRLIEIFNRSVQS